MFAFKILWTIIVVLLLSFCLKMLFVSELVKRRPSLFFKWTRFLIRKKWLKVRKRSGGGIEGVFLFEMNTRITCTELNRCPHVEFELYMGYDKIISFRFSKETKRIYEFYCHDNMNIKGNEMLLVRTIQDILSFGMRELTPKKSQADVIFALLQQNLDKEETSVEVASHVIPEVSLNQYQKLKSHSSQLLNKKELLNTEQIYFIESMMEERIPSLFKELQSLSKEKQSEFLVGIESALQEVQIKFQEYDKQIEKQISFELQKQLKSIIKIIGS